VGNDGIDENIQTSKWIGGNRRRGQYIMSHMAKREWVKAGSNEETDPCKYLREKVPSWWQGLIQIQPRFVCEGERKERGEWVENPKRKYWVKEKKCWRKEGGCKLRLWGIKGIFCDGRHAF
jgi:hypothetical protein